MRFITKDGFDSGNMPHLSEMKFISGSGFDPDNLLEKTQPKLKIMSNMNVQVEIRNIYGEEKVYPICETAITFAEIAGSKTLTSYTISKMKKLGYEFEVVQKPVRKI